VTLSPLSFNRARWDAAYNQVLDGSHTRERMADALVASKQLVGMSRAEVFALLGEPPATDKWPEYDLVYWLGPTHPFPIDSEWLVMRLSVSGKVTEADRIAD